MQMKKVLLAGAALLCAAALGSQASAAQVPAGTVSVSVLKNPAVTLTPMGNTFVVNMAGTFEISGSGGFTLVGGGTGTLNGSLTFSSTPGAVIAQPVANFFVFDDGSAGTYNFSVSSVEDLTYSASPDGKTHDISLYLLGTIVDGTAGLSSTPSSLNLSFNNNGSSAYAAAATLSVPPSNGFPVGPAPEPGTWALMMTGVGLAGVALRRRGRYTLTSGMSAA